MKTQNRYSKIWNSKVESQNRKPYSLDQNTEAKKYCKKIKRALIDHNLNKDPEDLVKLLKKGIKSKNEITKDICNRALSYSKSTGQVFLSTKQIWVLAFNLSK